MRERWPQIRAGLIVLAVAVSLFEGCPVPNVQRRHVERPVGQREVRRWVGVLGALGVETTPEELTEDAIAVSEAATRRHRALLAPFAPFFALTQTRQRWSLFPVADPEPWVMHLEGSRDGRAWELLYRPVDPEHVFLRERLEYRRVRAIWNPGTAGPRFDYPRFVDWVARESFAARPELEHVRVRFAKVRVSLPGEPPWEGEPSWHFEERRSRAEVAP
ncbi:MAG TPA: hypothetical protein RMH85_29780 [Polyangiaceae bacterium LLY-WYZ-15_(1-7)]|nr:hypothetical protein [Polyangiaceae bacterium LLY-WYZ-15_(1-7)]HJL03646.1 hypothetical protein [Polyangiaceae bacterium LLY-WYZ-15_(1-7)]HJL12709.1 hypothetical protein [Polyangiaceae bacterium LLY-WYZ-15_(1-7)]HJL24589.1 hypothetical protein [Polyangiaceae bacterium LLY-WYZ-15_(1-7)]HJL30468.1 hypothetical protein [Polyangiaceae bacterium LLY-WYZ-15_(1-7)]